MNIDYKSRQNALLDLCRAHGLTAVAIVPGANMIYFTGLHFHLSERPIIALFSAQGMSIILPELEVPKLNERPDLEARAFAWNDANGHLGAYQQAVEELALHGNVLGIDGMTMRATEMLELKRTDPSLQINPVERDIVNIRARKRQDEIDAMRQAAQIAEQALANVLKWVKPGMTEREIARRLDEEMFARGAHELAFESLVQTGPNSANPHGNTTERELQAGEFLLIDYGAKVNGYPSDITRTFCLGEPTTEMQRMYETVLRANIAGRNAAKPGVPMGDVDKAARDVIDEAGYGQYFIHRTGHGLGLDTHEPVPQIASGVTDRLEPGMTFTVEPGIYVPGLGGVRIEDNLAITDDGADVLTSFPRTLAVG